MNISTEKRKTKAHNVKALAVTALMTALLCVLCPLSFPVGPVPVTLAVFVIFLSVYILGTGRGVLAVGIYLLIGFSGMPVFSGFSAGPAKLLGPTGGYLAGYLLMAWIAGIFIGRFSKTGFQILGMLLGLTALYLIGTIWFVFYMNNPALSGGQAGAMTFSQALAVCVLPFVPADILKIILAAFTGRLLQKRLRTAGLL